MSVNTHKLRYVHGENLQMPQILVILIISLAGISYGMLFSWTSPGISELVGSSSLNISLEQASYFTVIPQVSMILSAPIYSLLLNRIGRQKTALLIGIPQLLSWITTGLADDILWYYCARLIAGIGNAGTFTVLPLYISEISEPVVRGSWGIALVLLIGFGKFLVVLISAFNSLKVTAIIGGIMSLVYICFAMFLPESPYFLLMKNEESAAKKSLMFLRWRYDTDEELERLKVDVARQISETGTYMDLFKIETNRKALLICILLRCTQQYSGLIAFESYTQYMFQQAGGNVTDKMSAIIFLFTFLPAIFVFASVSEKFGRRKLTIFSSSCCAAVLTLEAFFFGLQHYSNLNLEGLTWMPLVGLMLYVLFCSSGLAFVPLLMQGELFSASIKAKATGIMTIIQAINSIVIPKVFQMLTFNFGIFTPFAMFACCTTISTFLCYYYLIETKGKTLEEIQQDLKGDKCK